MKRVILCVSATLISGVIAYSQALVKASGTGSTGDDVGIDITVDTAGNQYITGYFSGTVDFDPGPETFNLTSQGEIDVFVMKLNTDGNLVWAKQMGGSTSDNGRRIVTDGSGNVYLTGSFSGTADFDPGPGTFNLYSAGSWDIFICKLDADGNLLWVKGFGSNTQEDHGNAIAIDTAGNVYTTGSFKGTIDFDPGSGTANLTADYIDVFVCKLDTSGNYVWADKMGGIATDIGYAITVDATNNVYITGHFRWTNCDYDPGPGVVYLSTYGDSEEFIVKLNADGNLIWAKQLNTGAYNYSYGYGIAVDNSGNVYTTGGFKGTTDFDPGAGTFNMTAGGLTDGFVCKLNSSGDFVWAKILGGCQIDDNANYITLDAAGNVYTTGTFQYIADFDPGAGVYELHAAGSTDVFISKLTSSGSFVWARKLGGTNPDNSYSIAVDAAVNIYSTGVFQGIADLDPGTATYYVTSAGLNDIYLVKLTQTVWNGSISNAWNNPANWNSGLVPANTSNVIIPSGLSRYPIVTGSTEVKSLLVQSGASVTINPDIQLKVTGK
jgi:hypothetical protein